MQYPPGLPDEVSAVVLSGGRSRRMGTDKGGVRVHGRTLLERAVDALAGRVRTAIVVAPPCQLAPRPDWPTVQFTLEDPPFGGPVAGIAAGLQLVETREVMVLPVDLANPAAVVVRLGEIPPDHDGVALRDPMGWTQYLAARYRIDALRERLAQLSESRDISVRRFAAPLRMSLVQAESSTTADMDSPAQLCLASGEGRQDIDLGATGDRLGPIPGPDSVHQQG